MFYKFVSIIFAFVLSHAFAVSAQTSTDSVALRALQVGYVMSPERVYLHFDNTAYFLGETIWFKAFVTSHNDDRATTHSRVLYVELVSPEGYVVKTEKYKIGDDGTCNGEIFMNPSYLSGFYEIRAYTRYMLNWGDEAVFSRVFPVYDKVNNGDWSLRNMRIRERRFIASNDWVIDEKEECTLKFYPEGGHLVACIKSVVAFELKGTDGIETDGEITILADGKQLVETVPQHMGKGTFVLKPQKGVKYTARVTTRNEKGKTKKYKFELPNVEDEGVVLSVKSADSKVSLSVNSNFSAPTELGFAIIYRSSMGFYRNIGVDGSMSVTLPMDSLPEGVCRAIVFSGKTPLAERLFFVRHDTILSGDRHTVRLNVTANGKPLHELKMKPHGKVTLNIAREDGKPLELDGGLAVSVADQSGSLKTSWGYNMYTWQLLGSELRGYIPDAWQYFDHKNEKRNAHLDLIMLTHGWTAYDWSKLTATSLQREVPPEKCITLRGQHYRRLIGHSLGKIGEMSIKFHNNAPITLHIPKDTTIALYVTRCDSTGCFLNEFEDFYGRKIVSLTPKTQIRQTTFVHDAFMIDRYFSPNPRFLSYWERNTGSPYIMESVKGDTVRQTGENSYELLEFALVGKRKSDMFRYQPISELRLDYMDEWEYALDVTFRYGIYDVADGGRFMSSSAPTRSDYLCRFNSFYGEGIDTLFRYNTKRNDYFRNLPESYIPARYLFRDRLPNYSEAITVSNVIESIFSRYSLGACSWVMPAVIKGEYTSGTCPELDNSFLHGVDVEKLTNFSEIIISRDEKHCRMFHGGEHFWRRFAVEGPMESIGGNEDDVLLDGPFWSKVPYSFFFDGFYKQKTIYPTRNEMVLRKINRGTGGFHEWATIDIPYNEESTIDFPRNEGSTTENTQPDVYSHNMVKRPGMVAFLIPPTSADSSNILMKVDLSRGGGVRRYTSLQGYSKSKQFYSPDYSNTPADPKDYRRTLLWNPSISSVDGKVEVDFYNSSECQAIRVDIAGMDRGVIYGNDEYLSTNCSGETVKRVQPDKNEGRGVTQPGDNGLPTEEWCSRKFNIAEIYFAQQRYSKCIDTYAELAQYEYAPALFRVAQLYRHGIRVKQDKALAIKFYKRAVEKGDAPSLHELATMYMNGEGVEPSIDEALQMIEESAACGYAPALLDLGDIYIQGTLLKADTLQAVECYREAAIGKNVEALYKYASYMQENGIERDAELGSVLDCMNVAANEGYPDALYFLVMHYDAAKEYKKAYRAAYALHLQNDKRGTKYVADCYMHGRGVSKDKSLANDLYREAGSQK